MLKEEDGMKISNFKMKIRGLWYLLVVVSLFAAVCALSSCGGGGGGGASGSSSNVSLSVISTNETSIAEALDLSSVQVPYKGIAPEETNTPPAFSSVTSFQTGYINSGAPDYLKITMTKIQIEGSWGSEGLWEGTKELVLDGSPIDVSDISQDFTPIPAGTATKIIVTFKSTAKVKGTLTASFNTGGSTASLTVKTKADYAYDAINHTGGASDYTSFVGGDAEEMDLPLSGDQDTFSVEAPCNETITENSTSNLTILFDINRVLRFYDGKNGVGFGGVNPPDPRDKAYFFGHSLLGTFIAPFFGTPGRVEGYKAVYSASGAGVYAWMTLVFDGDGNFLKGMLMGDDDNALTIAKGIMLTFDDAGGGLYDFTYDIANGDVSGFGRVSTLNYYSPLVTFSTNNGAPQSGEAYFQLQFLME
jgi:hypothetical protein